MSLIEEHRGNARQHTELAALEEAQGDERAARRHRVIAAAYARAAQLLANERLLRATPSTRFPRL